MPGFLIEYNRRTGDRRVREFPGKNGHREALHARFEAEERRPSNDWEVVSLNSGSLSAIRTTHSRYFSGQEVSSL